MSFWNKLGKIALQAAPYVAAPFTAGASLYAIPATQKLGEKWASHDAKKAAEKGLAPSKFDKYLGMASNVASLASGTGALGKFGSAAYSGAKAAGTAANVASKAGKAATVAKTAGKLSNWQNAIKMGGQTASMAMGGSPYAGEFNVTSDRIERGDGGGMGGWQGAVAAGLGGILANRGGDNDVDGSANDPAARGIGPSVAPRGGSSVANALRSGKREAVINQPFRLGYQTEIQDGDQLVTHDMPPIYPNIERRRPEVISPPVSESGTPIQNALSDELTPRRKARKRYPSQEATE